MSTGGYYLFSDGKRTTTLLDALVHLKTHPDLTVALHEGGFVQETTERLKAILANHGYGPGV